ncbi:MAG: hypothetical protein IT210_19030 [Armatimonadetes bacterium]|nr:hypothetical protein [Armatimonadota bacterium]
MLEAMDATENVARLYAEDAAFDVLTQDREPRTAAEIAEKLGQPVESMTNFFRHVMTDSSRFIVVPGRRWDLAIRYADSRHSTERLVNDALKAYGRPMPLEALAFEISTVMRRPASVCHDLLDRFLHGKSSFFFMPHKHVGRGDCILDLAFPTEDDIIYENFLDKDPDVPTVRALAASAPWDRSPLEAVEAVLKEAGRPVSRRAILFAARLHLGRRFQQAQFLWELSRWDRARFLSDGTILHTSLLAGYEAKWPEMASTMEEILEESIIIEEPVIEEEEIPVEEPVEAEAAPVETAPVEEILPVVTPEEIVIPEEAIITPEAAHTPEEIVTPEEVVTPEAAPEKEEIVLPEPVAAREEEGISIEEVFEEEVPEEEIPVPEPARAPEPVAAGFSIRVTGKHLNQMYEMAVRNNGTFLVREALEVLFDIQPNDPHFLQGAYLLNEALQGDPRVLRTGAETWRLTDTVPLDTLEIPEALAFPEYTFETPDGEPLDRELEDDGLEESLRAEIRNPLAQDVGDCDPLSWPSEGPESVRCAVTYRHRENGTLPLCQIDSRIFPEDVSLIEAACTDDQQVNVTLWINRATKLVHGMDEWYFLREMPPSGAVFTIERTSQPDQYRLRYDGETEPLLHIDEGRLAELLALRQEAEESGEISTFDLVGRILADHRTGLPFIRLFTELNVVRKVRRRLAASILSSYHCFRTKQSAPGMWQFDERKVSQGFNKAKRKYIIKKR